MRNNNQAIVRKLARKSLAANFSRNVFLVLAIFMTTFMIATVISLCVNQIETQRLYLAQYVGTTSGEIETILYVLVVVAVIFIVSGYLLVYNVMSFSVSRDIRFYGLLKTIGMSPKQIKRMVLRQIILLCAVGIPLGLLFSALVSLVTVPMFLNMYTQFSQNGYSISFHPLIFIGAALFTLITAITGAYKPAGKAARFSPIEAARFSEYGYVREKIRSSAFSPIKMAWRNVFRVPKRTVPVFCGMFLGMTMFMVVTTILDSTSIDMFVKEASTNIKGDIYLRNNEPDRYGDEMYVFTPEFMSNLNVLPGLTEMRVRYIHRIQMDISDTEGNIRSLPGNVYGVDAKGIAELSNELESPIDETAFEQGKFVIIRDIWREPLLTSERVEFSLENIETPVSFELGGVLPPEYLDYFGVGYNRLPSVYMSTNLLKKLIGEPAIYEIELYIDKSEQKQALNMVREWSDGHKNIVMRSGIAIREEAENIIAALTVIGGGISAVLWLLGVLNFVNIITTSILARRHELALLESVGQSARQSKKTLTCEGLVYASVTLLLVSIFGSATTYWLVSLLVRQMDYVAFNFPFVSFFAMVITVFVVCLSIPRLIYRFISKMTIVERLKKVE